MASDPPRPTPPGPPPRLFVPNEALASALEIVALVALAAWGWHHGGPSGTRLLQAIAAPLVAAVVWGLFAAPRARFSVTRGAQLAVKALVFGAATWALFEVGWPVPGAAFAVVVVVNTVAATVWRGRGFSLSGQLARPPQGPRPPR